MENITTTITVPQSPEEVFRAVLNVRGWWTDQIEGRTDQLGAEFVYRFKKAYRTKQTIAELVPNEKVVWHVTDCYVNFDKEDEWTGTDVVFEIARKGRETELRLTHVGLDARCSCYEACVKGWGFYVGESLRDLVTTGKGQPATEAKRSDASFTKSFVVDRTPEQAFDAITDVRGWWSKGIEGRADAIGATFLFRYADMHRSTQRVVELARGKRVVWRVDDAELGFVKNRAEWKDTHLVFEIEKKGDATAVRFTHMGLVPNLQCHGACSDGWSTLLDGLRKLIEKGKGAPLGEEAA